MQLLEPTHTRARARTQSLLDHVAQSEELSTVVIHMSQVCLFFRPPGVLS